MTTPRSTQGRVPLSLIRPGLRVLPVSLSGFFFHASGQRCGASA